MMLDAQLAVHAPHQCVQLVASKAVKELCVADGAFLKRYCLFLSSLHACAHLLSLYESDSGV